MGRRALRPIDPSLDLSRHWKTLDEVPCPFDAAAFFGRSAPLEVEMGSGKGMFLSRAAAEHPDRQFVGIELARKYSRFAAAKLARAGRDNALMLHGDGLRLFREFLPHASVDRVHVYFPDPWWKKRHHKRRVMNEAFLADVQRVLKPGGRLVFWTDVFEYFESTLALVAESTRLSGPIAVEEQPPTDSEFRTHFERRMRIHEEPVYRAEFEKGSGGVPAATCDR